MDRDTRIFLAGHTGMVGSALLRVLKMMGYRNIVLRSHKQLDLTDQSATQKLFQDEKPEVVILAAAKVGGIYANSLSPADFLFPNLAIQNNVIEASLKGGVKTLLFLGSSCIYPRDCPQPIKEQYLLTGPLEPTNRAYAIAKLAGVEYCWACNKQYGTRYFGVMPTNLYGPGDNYKKSLSHVVPGLIQRIHEAKDMGRGEVVVWGTGKPKREFLYSDDLAAACLFLLVNLDLVWKQLFSDDQPPIVNIGVGREQTIGELANRICKTIGYSGAIRFDPSKPDGTPRKLLDITKIRGIGWEAKTSFDEGIEAAYADYLKRHESS